MSQQPQAPLFWIYRLQFLGGRQGLGFVGRVKIRIRGCRRFRPGREQHANLLHLTCMNMGCCTRSFQMDQNLVLGLNSSQSRLNRRVDFSKKALLVDR
jgi:hypothetical protein